MQKKGSENVPKKAQVWESPPRDVYRSGFCQNKGGKVSRSPDQALIGGSEGKEKKDSKMRITKSKNHEKCIKKIIKQAYEEV